MLLNIMIQNNNSKGKSTIVNYFIIEISVVISKVGNAEPVSEPEPRTGSLRTARRFHLLWNRFPKTTFFALYIWLHASFGYTEEIVSIYSDIH